MDALLCSHGLPLRTKSLNLTDRGANLIVSCFTTTYIYGGHEHRLLENAIVDFNLTVVSSLHITAYCRSDMAYSRWVRVVGMAVRVDL